MEQVVTDCEPIHWNMAAYCKASISAEDNEAKQWQESDGGNDDEPHDGCETWRINVAIEL